MTDLTKYDEQFKTIVVEKTEEKEYKNLEDGDYIAYLTSLEVKDYGFGDTLVWDFQIENGRKDKKFTSFNKIEQIKKDFEILGWKDDSAPLSELLPGMSNYVKECLETKNPVKIKLNYWTKSWTNNDGQNKETQYKSIKGLAD